MCRCHWLTNHTHIMKTHLTGVERTFSEEDIIVSKTDLRGIITYANDVFVDVSGYAESELLKQPHNILRHPDMPACVFQLLWEQIEAEKEIFAYVINRCKNGDHYWVFAHVTPSYDLTGKHTGYHSNRRSPYSDALQKVIPLYGQLLDIESRYPTRKQGMQAARAQMDELLASAGVDYDQFVFSLSEETKFENQEVAR